MKKSILILVAALALGASASMMEIWSNQPALDWNDRYPIGNGLVGAMVTEKGETLIEVLPALPSRWRNGSVKGFRARGGHTVDTSPGATARSSMFPYMVA